MTPFLNAFHAPSGAHSSFTLGCKGKEGGLGLEMGWPACENVYIGLQNREDHSGGWKVRTFQPPFLRHSFR